MLTQSILLASPVASPVIKSDQSQTAAATDAPKPYCSQFDLTKRIPASILEEAKTEIIQWNDDMVEDYDDYENLLNKIRKVVLDGNFSSAIPVAPGTPRNALRVAIHSLASPSWQSKSPYVCLSFQYIGIAINNLFSRIYTSFVMRFEDCSDFHLVQPSLLCLRICMTKCLM